jgi:hypothetical protein
MKILPGIVTKFVMLHDAWIVGSAAKPGTDFTKCRDIDVLVPYAQWPKAALLIPPDAKPNTFGGWKFTTSPVAGINIEVDVWPDDIGTLMTVNMSAVVWHPRTNIRWFKTTE